MKIILFIAAVLMTECNSVRLSALTKPTTTSTPAQMTQPTALVQEMTPPTFVCPESSNTASPVARLRAAMKNSSYTQMNAFFDAFLVFYSDEHLSEEPAAEERRLEYISGWEGSGTAVVADDGAALWVPSADLRRARATVSCLWLVLDQDDPRQPTIAEWIAERRGRSGKVGADARLTSISDWQALATSLQRENLQLVPQSTMLDQLWNEEMDPARRRPEFTRVVAMSHNQEYTGMSWREKVNLVRNELQAVGADAMIVTALDEVAWLLNIRGKDLPYAPLLKAFVLLSLKDVRVYVPPGKLLMPERDALSAYNCFANSNNCTRVNEYGTVYSDLRRAIETKILIPTGGTFQRGASAAIAQSIPQTKRLFQTSPIIYFKAQKNSAEIHGMKKAHLRDAVAMCTVLNYIEKIYLYRIQSIDDRRDA
ncbi:xaa-Pro aminopeptidase 1-like [Leptidea sinapis]|uniref:xaa-Pro aminopeptidase 1-like n=1 Tax=Leptidea sinapis TaxID=189913 RepID=UPI0021357EBD|nr:xaa-Pro aminopeptidase 1-like [Leptidea sinapis]